MTDRASVFDALIGRLVWQVERGIGKSLTMEFGDAHLRIREPVEPRFSTSPKAIRLLRRRRVSVRGDWHLWIELAEWKVATTNFTLDHRARRAVKREECLQELDGQRLLTVASGIDGSLLMKFDLGGTLAILPWTKGSDGYQWSLYAWSGEIVMCRLDGSLEIEMHSNPAG